MKKLYYKFLVRLFYLMGDISCRFGFLYPLYQFFMKLSCEYDEKINWSLWKKPKN